MIDTEEIQVSRLPIGASPGQIILLVDLSKTPNPIETLNSLEEMGYEPQLKFCVFTTGVHLFAVLKDEKFDPSQSIPDEYLMDEWVGLVKKINQNAVSLWRGHPKRLREEAIASPVLQVSVHDWTNPGTTVWTRQHGHLCPPLETPTAGNAALYIDYRNDFEESLIQAHVELAIDEMGYPAGPRWIGRTSLDVDTVVSFVGLFPQSEIAQHVERLQDIVPRTVLATFDGEQHKPIAS